MFLNLFALKIEEENLIQPSSQCQVCHGQAFGQVFVSWYCQVLKMEVRSKSWNQTLIFEKFIPVYWHCRAQGGLDFVTLQVLVRCSNFDLLSLQSGFWASQVLWLQIRLWPGLRFGLGLVSWACQVLKVAWTEVSCSSVGRRPRQQSVGHDQQARSLSVNRTQGRQQATGANVKKVRTLIKDIGHKH